MKLRLLNILIVIILTASCATVFVDISEQLGMATSVTVPPKHPEFPKLSGNIAVAFLFKTPVKTVSENGAFISALSDIVGRTFERSYPLGIIKHEQELAARIQQKLPAEKIQMVMLLEVVNFYRFSNGYRLNFTYKIRNYQNGSLVSESSNIYGYGSTIENTIIDSAERLENSLQEVSSAALRSRRRTP